MESLINWMADSTFNEWTTAVGLVWPTAEIFHFLGLSLLIGSMLIIDLRLFGFFRTIRIETTHKLLRWALLGFGMNFITGLIFLFGNPVRYAENIGFRIKAVLIIVAGLNALWFYLAVRPKMATWGPDDEPPLVAKTVAVVSLGVWFAILVLGRMIPYVGTR